MVQLETHDKVLVVRLHRPEVRNAMDRLTAEALSQAFRSFEAALANEFARGLEVLASGENPTRRRPFCCRRRASRPLRD